MQRNRGLPTIAMPLALAMPTPLAHADAFTRLGRGRRSMPIAWPGPPAVVNAAEKRHFAWAYWQFEGSFGVYDIGQGHWIEPLHRALVSRDGAYSRRRPPLGATGAKP